MVIKARTEDATGVLNLINYWYDQFYFGDKAKGHLHSDNRYTKAIIERFINESEVSVAIDNNNHVVSFYLINHFFDIGNIETRVKVITDMIASGKLPRGRYAYRLAAGTHPSFVGHGLNKRCLNHLKELAKDKYDFFAGVMDYENIATQKSSLKMGWKHFGDIGIGILAITGTTDARNTLLNPQNNNK